MKNNKVFDDKRLLGVLDGVDQKFIAEALESYDLAEPQKTRKAPIYRRVAILAACLLILTAALPVVNYVLPRLRVIFVGEAGAGSEELTTLQNNETEETVFQDENETLDLTKVSIKVDIGQSTLEVLKDIAAASIEISLTDKKFVFTPYNENNDYNSDYYALDYYINRNSINSDAVGRNEVVDILDADGLAYLIFLSALLNDHPDAVAYFDIKYDAMTTNRLYSPLLFVCFEYKELGYGSAEEYLNAVFNSKSEYLSDKACLISFDNSKYIISVAQLKEYSMTNLYDTIFNKQ